ncbi:MAG: DUF4974 domain-containing protein [Bacteroidota bacterium]
MRKLKILVLAMLCLTFRAYAQPGVLDRKVSLSYKDMPLEHVLKGLGKTYGINFSYVNNLIPLQKKVSVRMKGETLRYALNELFKDVEVSYELVGNQIVLKYTPKKANSAIEDPEPTEASRLPRILLEPVQGRELVMPPATEPTIASVKMVPLPPYQPSAQEQKRFLWVNQYLLRLQVFFQAIASKHYSRFDSTKAEAVPLLDSLQAANIINDPYWDYAERAWQLTFVTPLGTNGVESANTVNRLSGNILVGVAAGLEGAEFGGLLNIEKDYMHGAQFAGLGNLVRNEVTGVQIAGITNISGKYSKGIQAAGFANVVADSAQVTQLAGFANVVAGNNRGGQFAGFANIAKGNVVGPQVAGFMNLATGNAHASQVAGFANISKGDVKGAQVAGFMNIAVKDVKGVQVAGFYNQARKVRGSQIGFLNVADSVSGIAIGFLSFVRHGYSHVEVWGSESLYGNVAFKTGTRHFYNILAAGIQPRGGKYRWGVGYGIGSEQRLSPSLVLNIDAVAYHINENEWWTNRLNLLNQLKLTLGARLSNRTYFFAGPTLNVQVSRFYNAEKNSYGSDLAPWNFYNHTNEDIIDNPTNIRMWIGFNAGFRF